MKIIMLLLVLLSGVAEAQTNLVIRAKAKDAKFIGSSIGGARVIIRDATTGKILDEGMIYGSTGNTEKIMKTPHERYKPITDEETARYETTLDISTPTFVEIEIIAPFNQKQAAIKASTQLWVFPGEHITGEGIVLEIPGFVVNVLSPQTHETISKPNSIELKANVVMMCGCTISSGGLWDGDKITVKAIINKDNEHFKTLPLKITEKDNTFAAQFEKPEPGLYEIIIYAFDERTGNTGLDKVNVIVK